MAHKFFRPFGRGHFIQDLLWTEVLRRFEYENMIVFIFSLQLDQEVIVVSELID